MLSGLNSSYNKPRAYAGLLVGEGGRVFPEKILTGGQVSKRSQCRSRLTYLDNEKGALGLALAAFAAAGELAAEVNGGAELRCTSWLVFSAVLIVFGVVAVAVGVATIDEGLGSYST